MQIWTKRTLSRVRGADVRIGQKNLHEDGLRHGGAGAMLQWWLPHTPESLGVCRRRPAVLILPGGGYHHVSEREAEPVALRFLAQGYGAFSLRYTCSPACFPKQLREAAMAMAYIRENAEAFGIDPAMVAAVGFSAGGHLCGMLGTMYDCPELSDLGTPAQLRPDALILCYPVAVSWGRTHEQSFANISGGDPLLRKRLSLDTLVRADMPPVFLWHTRTDTSVPCRNSLLLAVALEEAGVPFTMHIYRKGVHGLSTADAQAYPAGKIPETGPDLEKWPETAMEFLKEIGFQITDKEDSP